MAQPALETLSDLLLHVRDRWGGRGQLLSIRRQRRLDSLSTGDFVDAVHSLALALESRGVRQGDRLAIFSENCPEWHIADFACQVLGAITVPIYPNLPASQVGYILRNSGCRGVFYNGAERRAQLTALQQGITEPLELVALDEDEETRGSLTRLLGEASSRRANEPLDRLRRPLRPEDPATILYTSGTTGEPKGVVLSHRNLVSNLLACAALFAVGPDDLALSFLPLSHAFERTVDHLLLYRGAAIHYAPSIERLPGLLLEVRPTVLTSVPRVYERAYQRLQSQLERQGAVERRLFDWALGVGTRHRRGGGGRPLLELQRALAHQLVFRKVTDRFGGRLRFAISGGAPLARPVAELFTAMGLPIYQGYGLTETSPVLTTNHAAANRPGSVGRPVPGVELRIDADGEILARGPGVMTGYWQNPAATGEVLTPDGWFRTGDVGEVDADGFLYITDRKKDLLVTSGGKNIAPQPIERLLTGSGLIAQAVVVGDGYPHPAALLVPDFARLRAELGELPAGELVRHPRALGLIDEAVALVNAQLAEHERVRRWHLLEQELSLAREELTPTLKIRRRVVMQRYADQIAALYPRTPRP